LTSAAQEYVLDSSPKLETAIRPARGECSCS
jgi:hypothetical protein